MRILLIEDNQKVNDSLTYQLKREGFTVDSCLDGEEGLALILENKHDLILLDRMLPGKDGLEVLKISRNHHISIPVILITALGELDDKIKGLDTGADDYIVKPFEFQELMARIRSIRRRPRNWEEDRPLSYGDIKLDERDNMLYGQTSCLLSVKESLLLQCFLNHPEKTLSREMIFHAVWGAYATVEEGNIDNYIFLVRRKLKAVKSRLAITTIHRVGYRLEDKHD